MDDNYPFLINGRREDTSLYPFLNLEKNSVDFGKLLIEINKAHEWISPRHKTILTTHQFLFAEVYYASRCHCLVAIKYFLLDELPNDLTNSTIDDDESDYHNNSYVSSFNILSFRNIIKGLSLSKISNVNIEILEFCSTYFPDPFFISEGFIIAGKYGNIDIMRYMYNKFSTNHTNFELFIINKALIKYITNMNNLQSEKEINLSVFKFLIEEHNANHFNEFLNNFLEHMMIDDKQMAYTIIVYLVEKGANELKNCLVYASEYGHVELVKFFIDKDITFIHKAEKICCDSCFDEDSDMIKQQILNILEQKITELYHFKYINLHEIQEEFICVICQDKTIENIIEPKDCMHKFHRDCLLNWYEQQISCPLCRKF